MIDLVWQERINLYAWDFYLELLLLNVKSEALGNTLKNKFTWEKFNNCGWNLKYNNSITY